ncbi:acid protease [Trametes versicolor FP-101664 SS1]|uniref:acid protease n=1 Tax=Trametes versicolor (strain FP-101664) TaxID=717944 RepID=UPI0004622274|nr:acid protease [Trametes versicolor FP-101664 SS1]EIW62495.1 acid protease [Trametes versicolor FP-101664 SS1]
MGPSHFHPALRLLILLSLFSFATAYSRANTTTTGSRGIQVNTHTRARYGPNIGLATSDDTTYTVNITLGGQNFTVLLDTGSTDLWINSKGIDLVLTNTTNLSVTETYGIGEVHGTLQYAELRVGEYVVPSQAFINATQISDFDVVVDGMMGMAFDSSFIFAETSAAWGQESASVLGRSFITNLFAENSSLPNNFDVQLGRSDAVEDGCGTFVISGHAPSFVNVTHASKIPRIGTDRWAFAVDEMRVNGKTVSFNKSSVVAGAPAGKLVAMLDTGYSFPPIPPAAVDAIYRTIPGSIFSAPDNEYFVPCNSTTMVSFFLGGQEFPVHPLDLTYPFANTVPLEDGTQANVTVCKGTYQPIDLDPTSFAGFDMALGDAFLRNVCVSFDYGDFNPWTHVEGTPFVQIVSKTDSRTAVAEFYDERGATLAGLPPMIDPAEYLRLWDAFSASTSATVTTTATATASTTTTSRFAFAATSSDLASATASSPFASASASVSTLAPGKDAVRGAITIDDATGNSLSDWSKTFRTAVLALLGANLLIGLALLGVTVTMCVRAKKGRNVGSQYVPVRFKDSEATGHDAEYSARRYGSD